MAENLTPGNADVSGRIAGHFNACSSDCCFAEEQGEVEIEIATFLGEIGPCVSTDSHSH